MLSACNGRLIKPTFMWVFHSYFLSIFENVGPLFIFAFLSSRLAIFESVVLKFGLFVAEVVDLQTKSPKSCASECIDLTRKTV